MAAKHERQQLVEFYDREHLENVISLLYGAYSGVTFVCFKNDNEPDGREREMLQAFIPRKLGAQVQFLEVAESSISSALAAFRSLIGREGFWHFDICGGSSVFVAAVGMLYAEDGGRRMALHEYHVPSGHCRLCHPKDAPLPLRAAPVELTVAELLSLREIKILEGGQPVQDRLADGPLRREIGRLWPVVRKHARAWNNFCTVPTEYWPLSEDRIAVEKTLPGNRHDAAMKLVRDMERAGVLTELRARDGHLSYCLDIRPEEQFLYSKAGNLLEMLTALAVVDSGLCADCCVGIMLDWEDKGRERGQSPCNEIDVLAVRGHIPYFISCKNTSATNEHLYEIMIMTRHFGGAYAVPVMVATGTATAAIRDRAREMGVVLLDGVGKQSVSQFCAAVYRVLDRGRIK